ncbi:SDR family oxidoreductase, partial [Bacteroides thetaiotaomicron]
EQIEALIEQSDTFDGIVLCAGINDKSLLKFVNQKKIDDIYKVNVFSPILLIKELLRRKKLNKGASIVMLSSISSIYATISNALYASSKGAINSLVKVLALECSSQRIRVNGVMPGMVETNMIKAYNVSSDEMDSVIRTYPLGRLGTPNDIANGVVYLLSDASNWVTGINLVIDGGVTLR